MVKWLIPKISVHLEWTYSNEKKMADIQTLVNEIILKFWKVLSCEVIKLETRQMHQTKGFKTFYPIACNIN